MKPYQLKSLLYLLAFLLTTLVAYSLEPSEQPANSTVQAEVADSAQEDATDPAL